MSASTQPVTSTQDRPDFVPLEGSVNLPIYLLAALLPVRGLESLGVQINVPTNSAAAILLIGISLLIAPRWKLLIPTLTASIVGLVGWLAAVSFFLHGDLAERRLFNLLVLVLIAGVIGSGRLELRSVVRGLLFGYIATIIISVALLPESSYEGRLTGLLGDPNAAGYTVTSLGLALLQSLKPGKYRNLLLGIVAIAAVLTVSRTSMFALAVGLLWVMFSRRMRALLSLALLGAAMWLYQWSNELMDERGWFSEREGSDNLRERLLLEEQRIVDTAGWFGHGLGKNTAEVGDATLFFHNSYLSLQAEGGRVALILLIVAGIGLYAKFYTLPNSHRPVWAEAGIIAALICAFNIGFALTSVPIAVTIGLYLSYHGYARSQLEAAVAADASEIVPMAKRLR